MAYCDLDYHKETIMNAKAEREVNAEGQRWFFATVYEEFSCTYRILAKDEAEAKKIIEDGIPDDYSPSGTGDGYRRQVYIDPD